MQYLAGGVAFAIILFLTIFFTRRTNLSKLNGLLRMRLLLIKVRVAQGEESGKKDFKEEINRTSQLFGALSGMNAPFCLEAAVPNEGEEISFYLAVPPKFMSFAMRQVEGIFEDVQIEETPDYNIFHPEGAATVGFLKQKENYALPIRTYEELNSDSFSPILGALSKVDVEGEGMAIQIVVANAPKSAKKNIFRQIDNLRKGGTFTANQSIAKEFAKAAGFSGRPASSEATKEPKPINEELVKSLEYKTSKPLFLVNFRVVASGKSRSEAEALITSAGPAFSQFTSPSRNEFVFQTHPNVKKGVFDFSFRAFRPQQAMILNAAELSSIFHLPTSSLAVPKLKLLKSKEAPAPAGLPQQGIILGENVFRGDKKTIHLSDEDRRRHLYVIGQTGTGKTTLLRNLIIQDVRQGKGLAVIDPHGDLAEDILSFVPVSRADDVIVFDPGDTAMPLGLNMIEYNRERPEEKTFIVNEMQGIFNRLFPPESMGPMFEQYMRNALLLLMEDAEDVATLIEVPRVFTDDTFRQKKLSRAVNPSVIDFWEKEAVKAGGEAALANMTPYITSKFNNFISNDYLRPIIGQRKSAMNFREAMDQGKILLVKLPKGRIGDINANLLGMIIVGKILMASLSRGDVPEEQRKDFYLYIDEFQNFTTDSISTILSEARKYRLCLTLAHQFIAQLTDPIRESIFGNVGSTVSFRVGVTDAEFLIKKFEPIFSKRDLVSVDNFNAYANVLSNGQPTQPFNLKILPPEKGNAETAAAIKETSRFKYGVSRPSVEQEILQRLRN